MKYVYLTTNAYLWSDASHRVKVHPNRLLAGTKLELDGLSAVKNDTRVCVPADTTTKYGHAIPEGTIGHVTTGKLSYGPSQTLANLSFGIGAATVAGSWSRGKRLEVVQQEVLDCLDACTAINELLHFYIAGDHSNDRLRRWSMRFSATQVLGGLGMLGLGAASFFFTGGLLPAIALGCGILAAASSGAASVSRAKLDQKLKMGENVFDLNMAGGSPKIATAKAFATPLGATGGKQGIEHGVKSAVSGCAGETAAATTATAMGIGGGAFNAATGVKQLHDLRKLHFNRLLENYDWEKLESILKEDETRLQRNMGNYDPEIDRIMTGALRSIDMTLWFIETFRQARACGGNGWVWNRSKWVWKKAMLQNEVPAYAYSDAGAEYFAQGPDTFDSHASFSEIDTGS